MTSKLSLLSHALHVHSRPRPHFSREYRYVGTTAVWLPALNSDDDIRNSFANMSQVGIKVVRVYGFNGANGYPFHLFVFSFPVQPRCHRNTRGGCLADAY